MKRALSVAFAAAICAVLPALGLAREPVADRTTVQRAPKSATRSATAATSPVLGGVAAAPVNDNCDDAIVVTDGNVAFSNLDATTDGPDEPIMCNEFGDTQVGSDIWYEYTTTCSDELTVSLCGSDYDTRLALYVGCGRCPPSAGAFACNDDALGGICGDDSKITIPVVEGVCFTIRIGGHRIDEQGTGTLSIECSPPPPPTGACCLEETCAGTTTEAQCDTLEGTWFANRNCTTFTCPEIPPPPNDFCADAMEVFTDVPLAGTTIGTTGSDDSAGCGYNDSKDAWHYWVADCNGVATFAVDGAIPDAVVAVYDACDGQELGCADFDPGSLEELELTVVSGETYYVRVSGARETSDDYTLTVKDCTDPTPRACCGYSGSGASLCINMNPFQCVYFGATPKAPGVLCSESIEACCFEDGSCKNMDVSCCFGEGGTPGGSGTACMGDGDQSGKDDFCEIVPDTFVWLDNNGDSPGGFMPDFDQNQDFDNADGDADPTTGVDPFHGAPTAAADLLWWLDGKLPGDGLMPPGVTALDLIRDLAARMATNNPSASPHGHPSPYLGSWVDDVEAGLRSFLNSTGAANLLRAAVEPDPLYADVSDHVLADNVAALLVGFYHVESVTEVPESGFIVNWRRTGGHYVSVAGVDPDNGRIALSDPDADAAEAGDPGEVREADHDHDGDGNPGTAPSFRDSAFDHTKHNGGDLASHDVCDAMPTVWVEENMIPGGQWILAVDGDPLAYADQVAPYHVISSGGAFDVTAPTFIPNDFLVAYGYADPAFCQTYAVVEAALFLDPTPTQGCCLAGGSCVAASPLDCLLQDGIAKGPDTTCLKDGDGNGVDDVCDACPAATIIASWPLADTLDARQPHPLSSPLPRLGIGAPGLGGSAAEPIEITLDTPVPSLARCLTLCESNADALLGANSIAGVSDLGGGVYEIMLEHAIAQGSLTSIAYLGDPGGVQYYAHAANVSDDAAADENDVTELAECCLEGTCTPAWGLYSCDIDRSGTFAPADLLRLIDILSGASRLEPALGTVTPVGDLCP